MQIPPAPPPFLFHPGQLLRLFNLQLPLFFFFFFLCKRVFQTMKRVGSEHGTKRKEGVGAGEKRKKRLNRIWPSRSRHPRMKSAPGLNAHSVTHNEPILDLWERQRETLPFIPRIVSTIMIAYIYICTRMINRLIWIEARADIPPPFSWITLIHGLITRRLILFRPMVYEYSASVTKRGKAGGRGRK